MTVRSYLVVLALLAGCGICHADEARWLNFAEDADLKYYLDQKSVQSLPDNVYLFWVKSVAKDKEFFKREYKLQDLSYIFTNYEMDCAVSSYRVRGSIMFDRSRRELSKALPATAEPLFEPVPPESMLELAQEELCTKEKETARDPDAEDGVKASSAEAAAGRQSAAPGLARRGIVADEPVTLLEEAAPFEAPPARLGGAVPAEPEDTAPSVPPGEPATQQAPAVSAEPPATDARDRGIPGETPPPGETGMTASAPALVEASGPGDAMSPPDRPAPAAPSEPAGR